MSRPPHCESCDAAIEAGILCDDCYNEDNGDMAMLAELYDTDPAEARRFEAQLRNGDR